MLVTRDERLAVDLACRLRAVHDSGGGVLLHDERVLARVHTDDRTDTTFSVLTEDGRDLIALPWRPIAEMHDPGRTGRATR